MSMNIFAAFRDKKDRIVHKLQLYQTPTKLTYQIVKDDEVIELTLQNYLQVLDKYFRWMVKDNEFTINDIDQYRSQWLKDREEYIYGTIDDWDIGPNEDLEPFLPTNYKYNIVPTPQVMYDKILTEIQIDHLNSIKNDLIEWGSDYKCYLQVI